VEVSPAAALQLDLTVEEMLGHNVFELFPGLDKIPAGLLLLECMEKRHERAVPVVVRMPTVIRGTERDICMTITSERRMPGGLYIVFRWATLTFANDLVLLTDQEQAG
jgi:hypothetical protein